MVRGGTQTHGLMYGQVERPVMSVEHVAAMLNGEVQTEEDTTHQQTGESHAHETNKTADADAATDAAETKAATLPPCNPSSELLAQASAAATSRGLRVVSPRLCTALTAIMSAGAYTIASWLIMPQIQPADTDMMIMWNEEDAVETYEEYVARMESGPAHVYMSPCPHLDVMSQWRTEPPIGVTKLLEDEYGNWIPHEVYNYMLPCQSISSLDMTRVAYYQQRMRNGVIPTVLTHVTYKLNMYGDHGYDCLPTRLQMMNVVLDGHHKLHAAALEQRPVAVLAIIPHVRADVHISRLKWIHLLASVGYDARVYAHESAYHTAHHNQRHNRMAPPSREPDAHDDDG